MKVPRNVLWFEALLYASLMLDALSLAELSPNFGDGAAGQAAAVMG